MPKVFVGWVLKETKTLWFSLMSQVSLAIAKYRSKPEPYTFSEPVIGLMTYWPYWSCWKAPTQEPGAAGLHSVRDW